MLTRMKTLKPLFLGLLLTIGGSAQAIINGDDADPIKSASTVFLSFSNSDRTSCTGVIISENLILTAGHCFDNVDKDTKSIQISNNKNGEYKLKKIELAQKWTRHPLYKEPKSGGRKKDVDIQYDIAYLKTESNLLAEFELAEQDLPKVFTSDDTLAEAMKVQTEGMAYGYGLVVDSDNPQDNTGSIKKELPQNLELNSEINVIIARSLIKKRGVCQGDSGGGLYMQVGNETYVAGILSGISSEGGCGSKESYAAYSMIHKHLCWIMNDSGLLSDLNLTCSEN